MTKVEVETFLCPTLCGCVIRRTHTRSLKEVPDDHPLAQHLRTYVEERGLWTSVTTVNETMDRCSDPAHQSADGDEHWETIRHFHGNAQTVGVCKCRFPVWFDARVKEDDRVHVLVKNPVLIHACADHAAVAHSMDLHFHTAMADAHEQKKTEHAAVIDALSQAHAGAMADGEQRAAEAHAAATSAIANLTPDTFAAAIHAHVSKMAADQQIAEAAIQLTAARDAHAHAEKMMASHREAAKQHG